MLVVIEEVKASMPKFEREVEIDAPVEKVWEVITDPNHWPQWFPGVDSVSNVTSVGEGGRFEWADEGRTGQGVIVSMEPMRRLKIVTQMGDDKDAHEFSLRPSGGFLGLTDDECKVQYTLDTLMGGGIIGRFVAGGNPKDALRVKKAMHRFRRLVEGL
jgi:uncharacterized protein YndB with AHSA1/START domain